MRSRASAEPGIEDSGFDCLGVDSILGFDWLDVAKGTAGFLSGAGKLMSGSGKGQQQSDQLILEKQRLEEEKRRAEQSASNTRMALGIGGAALGATLLALLLQSKRGS